MTSFEYLWELLEPKKEYEPLRKRCLQLWETFALEKQRQIYCTIRKRKKEHFFVDYNPLFAIERLAGDHNGRHYPLTTITSNSVQPKNEMVGGEYSYRNKKKQFM